MIDKYNTESNPNQSMKDRTLPTHFEQFLFYLEAQGRKKRTVETYQQRLTPLINFLIDQGIVDTSNVKHHHIDAYIVFIRRQDYRWGSRKSSHPKERGGLSTTTIAGIIQVIKTFFRWCTLHGYTNLSPAGHLMKPKISKDGRSRAIRQVDLEALISTAKNEGKIRDYAILCFIADTGCRAGEVCSLTFENLNLQESEAHITGKSGERIVDFTNVTADAIQDWLAIRPDTKSNCIFTKNDNKAITYNTIYLAFRRIGKLAGVEKFNPHAIRHRVGQAWVDAGVNLELIRQKLGHKDIRTTADYYANQDRERVKRASHTYSILKDIL
jgi:site-specific recombinase XerD